MGSNKYLAADVHQVKIHRARLLELRYGDKTHEVREFDRDYKVGDLMIAKDERGEKIVLLITNITAPSTYGLPSHLGAMSVRKLHDYGASNV